jgi:ubiquinone/menaquinone biosynthesis C-methylase UbiE
MPAKLNRFNGISRWYDPLTSVVFGKAIRDAQTCHLNLVPRDSKVLVLGGGTGWWLNDLMKNDVSRIVYIEASEKMLGQARKNIFDKDRIQFIHGTEKAIPKLNESFDVIITFFYLDLFDFYSLQKNISILHHSLKHEGLWLVADFVQLTWWHRNMLRVMYLFFRLINAMDTYHLEHWEKCLHDMNMELVTQESRYGRFIKSGVYRKVKTIANNQHQPAN